MRSNKGSLTLKLFVNRGIDEECLDSIKNMTMIMFFMVTLSGGTRIRMMRKSAIFF